MKPTDPHADEPSRASHDRPSPEVDDRVEVIVQAADLGPVADALAAQRTPILERWLAVATRQPFHRERPELAVADHIPRLFDAVVAAMRRPDAMGEEPDSPLDDEAVTDAAVAHAQIRFDQGLGPVAIVTEFRLLRQEIGRGLLKHLGDVIPASDAVAGVSLIGDVLDGAATIGLSTLSDHIETLRESFLATTLHDVRQPITLVEGSLHLADRWLAAPEIDQQRVSEAVRDALVATTELVALIDTLSDASLVAMGALAPDPEPASLEQIGRDAVDALGPSGRARVRLVVAPGHRLIGLWDPSLIRRVVTNLVGNALKYSPQDSEVVVGMGPGDGPTARLEVRDAGLGMSDDDLAHVFERFARTDRARQSGVTGLGLGLYACRGIVTAHGGTIVVESDGHDLGTRVIVTLPTLAEDAEE